MTNHKKCQKQSARINNLIRDENQFQSKYESKVEKIRTRMGEEQEEMNIM